MKLLGQFQTFFYDKISQAQKNHKMLTSEQKEKRQRFMPIKNI